MSELIDARKCFRLLRPLVVGVIASVVASPVWANAGIGYFMLALPVIVVAFPVAILLEAFVIAPMLAVSIKRALQLSFGANLRSTLWGVGLGVAIDIVLVMTTGSAGPAPVAIAATVMLVPFFFLSWWIEHRAILRREVGAANARVATSTGMANLLSYAAMGACTWAIFPAHDPSISRAQVREAVSLMDGMKTPLTAYFEEFKKWPDSLARPGVVTTGKYTQSVAISKGAGGTGEIELSATMKSEDLDPAIAGRTVRALSRDQGKSWTCIPGTLEPRYLPGNCRGP